MVDIPQSHDALFRALLGNPERAEVFLRENLPNNIAAQLSDKQPVIMDGSFVDEALAKSQSDLLLKVETIEGTSAFVYILIEHKSYPDHVIPLQLAAYMVRIWQRHISTPKDKKKQTAKTPTDQNQGKQNQRDQIKGTGDKHLPPIIPMVLYHGEKRWTVPAGLGDMITASDPALVVLPGQSYIFRDLGQIDDDALSQHIALRTGLLALKRTAIEVLAKALAESDQLPRELIHQILTYILNTYDGLDLSSLMAEIGQHDKTLEALVGTIAETLIQKGEAQGMNAGLAQGRTTGLAEGRTTGLAEGRTAGLAEGAERGLTAGKSTSLIILLENRFGVLPDTVHARIDNADLADLDIWFRRALDVATLEAVFDTSH